MFKFLNYENFPKVVDYGNIGKKNYIIMERLGSSLGSYLTKEKPMNIESTVLIGIQVLKLLQQLHETRFVYGDLKPDNLCVG